MRQGNFERGEDRYNAVLCAEDVRQMRALHYEYFLPVSEIARKFDQKYDVTYDAVTFRRWRHVR